MKSGALFLTNSRRINRESCLFHYLDCGGLSSTQSPGLWVSEFYFVMHKHAITVLISLSTLRYPTSVLYVVVDILERLYLAGFPILLTITSAFPLLSQRFNRSAADTTVTSDVGQCIPTKGFPYSNMSGVVGTGVPNISSTSAPMEFLPLMLTSIYCSIGLIWSYFRLGFIYLNEDSDTLYRRPLSE